MPSKVELEQLRLRLERTSRYQKRNELAELFAPFVAKYVTLGADARQDLKCLFDYVDESRSSWEKIWVSATLRHQDWRTTLYFLLGDWKSER